MAEIKDVRRSLGILAVDNDTDYLNLLTGLLKDRYQLDVASSGECALALLEKGYSPDLILLDVAMPDIDGYEVCRRLKRSPLTREIPVIFLAARDNADETYGLELGAVDYFTKPIKPSIFLARVATHLRVKVVEDLLRGENHLLEFEVERRTEEATTIQDVTIHALASLAETRDLETGNHLRRTQSYVQLLARNLRFHPRFIHYLNHANTLELVVKCAPLHDIGKVGIPDRILLKPGKYDPAELEAMKLHTTLGKEAIERAEKGIQITLPFLEIAKEITYCHHEKWDGSGYPQGLSGNAIPISARLMAVADVYDALISRRIYKPSMPHERAVVMICEDSERHFDPDIVDAFRSLQPEFEAIARTYAEGAEEIEEGVVKIRTLHRASTEMLQRKAKEEQKAFIARVFGTTKEGGDATGEDGMHDHHHCPFGQWYDVEGQMRFGGLSAFSAIEPAHARAHELARKMVDASREGRAEEIRSLSAQLLAAHEEILVHVRQLETASG